MPKRDKLDCVVVMPTLNERESIEYIIDQIRDALKGYRYEIVVVDGRSVDGTDVKAREKGCTVVYQSKRGYGDALRTGFTYVKSFLPARAVVMMDADSTYDPRDIPRLITPVLKGEADMVVGNRFHMMDKDAMNIVNKLGNKLISAISYLLLKTRIKDTQSGFRAFRIELLDCLKLRYDGMQVALELIVDAQRSGAKIIEVPVFYRRRRGRSKLNPLKDGIEIVATILKFRIR